MTTFVIRTEDGQDLGFLLFARHEGDWPPAGRIDCVFTGFARDPGLEDDPRGSFVSAHKGREWTAEVTYTPTEMIVGIDLDTGWTFAIHGNEDGDTWTAEREAQRFEGPGLFL